MNCKITFTDKLLNRSRLDSPGNKRTWLLLPDIQADRRLFSFSILSYTQYGIRFNGFFLEKIPTIKFRSLN